MDYNISMYNYIASEDTAKDKEDVCLFLRGLPQSYDVPSISNECLTKILSLLSNFVVGCSAWGRGDMEVHFRRLEKLERCSQNSKDFSFETTVKIFQNHFNTLKEDQKYDIHKYARNPDCSYSLDCVAWAIQYNAPALLNAVLNTGPEAESYKKSECSRSLTENLFKALKFGFNEEKLGKFNLDIFLKKAQQCINILVNYGYNINGKFTVLNFDAPAVWHASFNQEDKLVKLLIKANAQVNIEGNHRKLNTPLACSVWNYSKKAESLVEAIIEAGGDLFGVNKYNETLERLTTDPKIVNYLNVAKATTLNRITIDLNIHFHSAISNIVLSYLGFSVRAADGEDHPFKAVEISKND